nr:MULTISPECIES: PhzF family phenazine biosynthesis protein [unclassified Streptomyces]
MRRRVPGLVGASHAVFVTPSAPAGGGAPAYALRFFTSEGELPACGHGTVAALARIAARDGEFDGLLHTAGR